MLFQDRLADLVQRGAHGGDLRQHFDTFAVFVPKPFQTGGMAGNSG